MRFDENALTALLLAACAALAVFALAPRVLERPVRLRVERPEVRASIEGAVVQPGVYALPWGARVADLVTAAGGLRPGAARELVALAAPLTDGEVVHVPGAAGAGGVPRVRVNSATPEELMRLPGVGPALAARIVEARPFSSLDELLRVPGIGPKTLDGLRSRARL